MDVNPNRLILVCINHRAETHEVVANSGAFAVNVLASDQHHLAEAFAGTGGVYGDRRFSRAFSRCFSFIR